MTEYDIQAPTFELNEAIGVPYVFRKVRGTYCITDGDMPIYFGYSSDIYRRSVEHVINILNADPYLGTLTSAHATESCVYRWASRALEASTLRIIPLTAVETERIGYIAEAADIMSHGRTVFNLAHNPRRQHLANRKHLRDEQRKIDIIDFGFMEHPQQLELLLKSVRASRSGIVVFNKASTVTDILSS